MPPKFNVIVAACENNGIGIKGDLPWRLKNEMAYFTKMTSQTTNPEKKNAVIMGRKTWESIPPKFKPLKGRLNVVLSKTLKETNYEDAVIFDNLSNAMSQLIHPPYSNNIENFWVIGGASVYKEAVLSDMCHRIYLTQINKCFDCDTFFPDIPSTFLQVSDKEVPDDVQEEKDLTYQFKVFEKSS
ncbi:dihydrofolate reductase [Rhodnius prolixus]|uniref:dihydrofolate reductase n=2 Tax=Rhodnius TaxID=13248 RepID=R4G4F4_RHOPR